MRELVTLGAERGDCEGIAERVLATRGRLYAFFSVAKGRAASGCKTLAIQRWDQGTKLRTHSYARKYAKSTGALKQAARNRYTAGKISGSVCCTHNAAMYNPPPNNPANDK